MNSHNDPYHPSDEECRVDEDQDGISQPGMAERSVLLGGGVNGCEGESPVPVGVEVRRGGDSGGAGAGAGAGS